MVNDGKGDASITITSGTMAFKPAAGWTAGCAWGNAGVGFVKGAAVELAPQIRVNAVAPGAIETPLLEGFLKRAGHAGREAFEKASLVKRLGQPEDMAEAYLYLMKDRFVTGQVLLSDGGRTLA